MVFSDFACIEVSYIITFNMDIRHLETFMKIAELKSFTKAAEMLYLTQPTVSKQIIDLERYFNVKLLERTKRNVNLTKAGELLLRYARDFVALKKETIEAIEDFKGLKKGTISVGASSIPGIYILPKVLNEFKKEYNGIQVMLFVSDTKEIMEKVERGEIDIGFVGAKDEKRRVEYRRFFEDVIVIAGPADYPDSIKAADLKQYPFIIREQGSGTRAAFDAFIKAMDIDPEKDLNIIAELTDTEAIKEAIRYGMGISYISRMAIANGDGIKELQIDWPKQLKRSFYIITRKGKGSIPQISAFIKVVNGWKERVFKEVL